MRARYKVGKYILETKRVGVWTRWEDDGRRRRSSQEDLFSLPLSVPLPPVDATAASSSSLKLLLDASLDMSLDTALEEVEFDSQDEDECEDLFMGVWTPEAAMRRRIAKGQFAAAAAAAAVGFGSG
ncbi:MAG: hypothetical protein GOMPHAMPRED_006807 [Gomphillus americanus]|uniref:Uncharacterized protein n=1 Tax=Gomphillus americanus TaxID=1940652 RepID=A0A8H3ESP6_9LECA|nr:MAG: hypothetical protein GOMPHAMPRED_006807 [Gomphillus americanus]